MPINHKLIQPISSHIIPIIGFLGHTNSTTSLDNLSINTHPTQLQNRLNKQYTWIGVLESYQNLIFLLAPNVNALSSFNTNNGILGSNDVVLFLKMNNLVSNGLPSILAENG